MVPRNSREITNSCVVRNKMDIPIPDGFNAGTNRFPTYKTLLDLKGHADQLDYWERHPEVPCSGPQDLLAKWVTQLYPAILIQRPGRFYQTVERLQLPTKTLKGDELDSYLSRTWIQRVTRNHKGIDT